MKIFGIFTLLAIAKAQDRKTETALKRVEDTRDAALQWIDDEIPQFRKAKKLRSR